MNRFRRKRVGHEKDKSEAWLLTYSDMVTLCLTFFVLLYSFSTIDVAKWKSIVISLQGALGVVPDAKIEAVIPEEGSEKSLDGLDSLEEQKYLAYMEETKKMEEIKDKLDKYLEMNGWQGEVTISVEERGVVIRFQDSVLFPKASAELYPESIELLSGLVDIFKELNNHIRVEGHTDDLPINTVRYPSNWELSTARATNVLRFLINQGLPGEKLSAVGYGEFRPVVENNSEDNRKKNRRVDIVLLRESLVVGEP